MTDKYSRSSSLYDTYQEQTWYKSQRLDYLAELGSMPKRAISNRSMISKVREIGDTCPNVRVSDLRMKALEKGLHLRLAIQAANPSTKSDHDHSLLHFVSIRI